MVNHITHFPQASGVFLPGCDDLRPTVTTFETASGLGARHNHDDDTMIFTYELADGRQAGAIYYLRGAGLVDNLRWSQVPVSIELEALNLVADVLDVPLDAITLLAA
jgi:hypothetical protein